MSTDDLVCYTIGDDFVTSTNQYFPCGPSEVVNAKAQNCCYAGDYCLQDGICHYTHTVQNGTGYYLGACTDPTWKDPACRKVCTSQYGQDIVYDNSNLWNCCDVTSTEKNCADPTDITFLAPAPQELQTVLHLTESVPHVTLTQIGSIVSPIVSASKPAPAKSSSGSLTSPSSSPSSAASTSRSSSPSNTQTRTSAASTHASGSSNTTTGSATASPTLTGNQHNSGDSGLSSGAKAGIGVGVAIGVLLLLGALFLLLRRRKRNQAVNNSDGNVAIPEKHGPTASYSAVAPSELGGWSDPRSDGAYHVYKKEQPILSQDVAQAGLTHELPAPDRRHELPTVQQ